MTPLPLAGEGECVLDFVGVCLVLGVRGVLGGPRFGVVAPAIAGERRRTAGGDSDEDKAGDGAGGDEAPWGVLGVVGWAVLALGVFEGLVRWMTDIVRTCRLPLETTDGARFKGDTAPGGKL